MRLLATASLSNQNLSVRTLLATMTADADRALFVRVFADQVAGNGTYVCDVTIQRLGAGSSYQLQPTSSVAVAAGVTSVGLSSVAIPVKSTDIVRVYLTGLAGDTTTPDTFVEWWEDDGIAPDVLAASDDAVLSAVAGLATGLADVPTNAELASALAGADDAVLAAIAALALLDQSEAQAAAEAALAAYGAALESTSAAIRAKTDLLPADPASQATTGAAITAATAPLMTSAAYVEPDNAGILAAVALAEAAVLGVPPEVWLAMTPEAANRIADHVLRRDALSAEESLDGDAIGLHSVLGLIRGKFKSSIVGGIWTILTGSGATLGTRAVTSSNADPVTGVSDPP